MTTIRPYDFLKLKNGSYLLVKEIRKRVVDIGLLDDIIIIGDLFQKKSYENNSLDKYIGIEGKSSKNYLNLKTCSYQQLSDFMYNKNEIITKDYWIDDFSEIDCLISRNQTFKLKQELKII